MFVRGRPTTWLADVSGADPLEELARRGLITPPARSRSKERTCKSREARYPSSSPSSDHDAHLDTSALVSALALGEETTLITWDKDLGRAAIASGCGVAPALRGRPARHLVLHPSPAFGRRPA